MAGLVHFGQLLGLHFGALPPAPLCCAPPVEPPPLLVVPPLFAPPPTFVTPPLLVSPPLPLDDFPP
jgi:hypothetical protein